MTLANKLDKLQDLAIKFKDCEHKLYLINLLAEHAEEDEITINLLYWVANALEAA